MSSLRMGRMRRFRDGSTPFIYVCYDQTTACGGGLIIYGHTRHGVGGD